MKTSAVLSVLLASAVAGFAQSSTSSTSTASTNTAAKANVISTYRVSVKPGHEEQFEAALKTHAQRFHTKDWSWRVGEVLSGPEGNLYQIVEGPFSWTALDSRGDLGAEHMRDYSENIVPHVEKQTADTYAVYEAGLSTAGSTQYASKCLLRHFTVKPGKTNAALQRLQQMKSTLQQAGAHVAVWRSVWSGEPGFTLVFRLAEGWKDLDGPLASALAGSSMTDGDDVFSCVSEEMVEFHPELTEAK